MRFRHAIFFTLGALLVVGSVISNAVDADDKIDLPLIFEDNFEEGGDHWKPTDPGAWKITQTDDGKVYEQFKLSSYKRPHNSPFNISILKDIVVGDFVFTVKVKSTTGRKNGHRDMCVFFGYQNSGQFYYSHQGLKTDPKSNQIFIVDKADRLKISDTKTPGCNWTDEGWHQIKVVRRIADGTIEIYFDDMKTPAKTAIDKNLRWGQVGLGSFDDTGQWDDFKLYGVKVKEQTEREK